MRMGIEAPEPDKSQPAPNMVAKTVQDLRTGFRELQWLPVLLYGIGSGLLMPFSMVQAGVLAFVAGIIPVSVGLLLARSVRGHYGLHGFMAGLIGSIVSFLLLGFVIFFTPFGAGLEASTGITTSSGTRSQVWITISGFISFSLIAFSTFGATTAGRIEDRNRQTRKLVADRGGQLERAGTIRGADDIRGLSLPQFGWYVNNLFKKKGFTFKDYRFIDKDKHLDIWMEFENQPYHMRLSVADKISPGTVESLLQEMKREGCDHGIVLTSTEFMPSAVKTAKDRPVVLIDGATLYEIAEQ